MKPAPSNLRHTKCRVTRAEGVPLPNSRLNNFNSNVLRLCLPEDRNDNVADLKMKEEIIGRPRRW